jgi:hypothetical protein
MKKGLLIGCAVIFFLNGQGQIFHEMPSYRYSITGAYSLRYTDAFSCTDNPASLGGVSQLHLGVLAENKWMLEGLNNCAFAVSFPIGAGGTGIVLRQNGDEAFKEQGLELNYGKNLGRLDIGIVFDYLRDQAAGYETVHFISSGVGLRYRINEKLITGWELGLPVSGKIGKTNPESAPQYFRMGFGCHIEDDLFLSLQIEKQSGQPADFFGNIEYRCEDHFIFSAGISSGSDSFIFKTGWKKNGLSIQLCLMYEPILGISPGLLLLWETKNKAE